MIYKHSHEHESYVPPQYRHRLPDELRNAVMKVIHDIEQENTKENKDNGRNGS